MSRSEFLKAGERIHILERYMNTREGITIKDDTLPGRLLKEGRKCDPKGRVVPLEKMREKYYRIRSYDAQGIPTKDIMKNFPSKFAKKDLSWNQSGTNPAEGSGVRPAAGFFYVGIPQG